MSNDYLDENIDEQYPVEVVDGAYSHFLEGFVSLVFFRDIVLPPNEKDVDMVKVNGKRKILFELRIPISRLKILMKELEAGSKLYSATSLLTKNRDFWTNPPSFEDEHEDTGTFDSNEIVPKIQDIGMESISKIFSSLSEDGKEKISEIVSQCLHDNMEQIRAIAQEDVKNMSKKGIKNESSKRQNK